MTGSTKILTVSYGTFSCTLEGFDDPFATMRGIAEYFRDLAADDRYFGAEPPTPDVDMLQSIASQSARRAVSAQRSETGIALRQVEEAESAAPAAAPKETPPVEKPEAITTRAAAALAGTALNAGGEDALDHGPLAMDDEYLMADEPEDILAVDPAARVQSDRPAESVAEKLRRIRAVVSRSIEQETDAPFSEADAASAAPKRDRANTRTIESIVADLADEADEDAADDMAASGDEAAEADMSDRELSRAVQRLKDEIEEDRRAEMADESVAEAEDEFDAEEGDAAASEADGETTAAETETAETEADDAADVEEPLDASAEAEDAYEDEGDNAPDEMSAEDEAAQPDEAEEMAASEDDAQDDENDEAASDDEASDEIAASSDDAPTDDASSDDASFDDAESDSAHDADIVASVGRRLTTSLSPITEESNDVGRLMTETDSKLREDENVRRRRVISQMRAAVAATKADRLISRRVTSKELEESAEQSPYREDLSDAMTTGDAAKRAVSRPARVTPSRIRPTTPLILVSSQRVDTVAEPEDSETESFAGFASTMGATELTDLLEAAAAYTTFVEGNETFSRPEIMKRVARYDPALRLTREDGLRSFGQLLRQGTLKKIERGQFAIASSSRFNPQQKIAGE